MNFLEFMSNLRQWGMEYFGKYYGPYRAKVKSNRDPQGIGRIRVSCPRALIQDSPWILPMMHGAGSSSGEFWPPEPGDTVWVFFDNGNPETPGSYIGGWFTQGDLHEDIAPTAGESPMKRGWVSPGGHRVILDDTKDKKAITITTEAGSKITLDDTDGGESILIRHKNGKIVKITTEGKVKMGAEDGTFEPMLRGSTVKEWLVTHTHPHAWGPTGPAVQAFPVDGLSDDTETS
jgi:uncharacterized protein involved in type VI secretion and phage assembly